MNHYFDTTDLDPDSETVEVNDCPMCKTANRKQTPAEKILGWAIVGMLAGYVILAIWIEFELFNR